MLYNVGDSIPTKKLVLCSVQMLLSIFVATALIASICGVDIGAALVGAGLSTIIYSLITNFKSPMFISNSGAFVAPVIFALGLAGYSGVVVGGLTTAIVYSAFGIAFKFISVDKIYKIFPKALIGSVTIVIGINLMGFIPTYLGDNSQFAILIALVTMLVTAVCAVYANGIFKLIPFLIGILSGYVFASILTIFRIYNAIDFTIFNDICLINIPNFAFTMLNKIDINSIFTIIILYAAYTISAMMECLSDHAALSGIIGIDLYQKPGLSRIFIGEGLANIASSLFGGLGACSYGEGVACIGFSRVSSAVVTSIAALMLVCLGFFGPIQVFISSIPSCVFAGSAIILYGFIASSGIKMLNTCNLNSYKNLIIVSAVLSTGISGIIIGGTTLFISGTALSLIIGIILNFILVDEK